MIRTPTQEEQAASDTLDAAINAKLKSAVWMKTDPSHRCATLVDLKNGIGLADPCYIIPESRWSEFVKAEHANGLPADTTWGVRKLWHPISFDGVDMQIRDTGGDGAFYGVAVDAGMVAYFDIEKARSKFGFKTMPV